jgi:hypothetical protein
MTRKIVAIAVGAAVLIVAGIATWQLTRPPAIVASLRQLSEVARVEYTGPADSPMILIHLRDWHHVPRELCKLDGIDFEENLAIVEKVQDDQLAIARFLIREHGLTEMFSEGLSHVADLDARLGLLRTLADAKKVGLLDAEGRKMQREMTLEVGVPGRLLLAEEIAKVRPVEDEAALKAAGPGASAGKIEARRRAIVNRLPKSGIALLVLGGSHELGPYLGDVLYIRVTPRSYPGE